MSAFVFRRCSSPFAALNRYTIRRPKMADTEQQLLKQQQGICIYFIRVSTEIPRAYQRTMGCTKNAKIVCISGASPELATSL